MKRKENSFSNNELSILAFLLSRFDDYLKSRHIKTKRKKNRINRFHFTFIIEPHLPHLIKVNQLDSKIHFYPKLCRNVFDSYRGAWCNWTTFELITERSNFYNSFAIIFSIEACLTCEEFHMTDDSFFFCLCIIFLCCSKFRFRGENGNAFALYQAKPLLCPRAIEERKNIKKASPTTTEKP